MAKEEMVELGDLEVIKDALKAFAGIDKDAFELSRTFWTERRYKKGEYMEPCKHLGFVVTGIFRTYYACSETGEQKNVFFCSEQQMIVAHKSMEEQSPYCYCVEAMMESIIVYIHTDRLQELYGQSHHWERFGRLVAEAALNNAMSKTELLMFATPETGYRRMISQHRNITERIPLYHIASYLGIQGPSLSRIRRKIVDK